MIGLPPGVGLDVSIWGAQGQRSAQLGLVRYHDVKGKSLFNRGTLPTCGLDSVCLISTNAVDIINSGRAFPSKLISRGHLNTLAGEGIYWSIYTPADFRIDLIEPI